VSEQGWRLAWYAADVYAKEPPPATPPETAELSGDGAWASLYADDGRTLAASWIRPLPDRPLVDAARERGVALQRARLDADRSSG
jgi:hypothetical protein